MADYQGISPDEENQNIRQASEETSDKNGETTEEISREQTIPTGIIAEVYKKVCCWKCLTSEFFLLGIPAMPIVFAVLILLALIVNYSIAVSLGHVAAFLPYVSWLGSQSPEEYIFDFIMSLAIISVAFVIYFKFKIIADNYQGPHMLAVMIINKACAWIGFLASLLFLMSSTFPAVAEKRILKVHSFASISAFTLVCIYFIIETVMSFKIQYHLNHVTWCVSITRAVFAVLSPVCLILSAITGNLSYKYLEKGKNDKQWGPEDGGYGLHVTAAFCEWALVLFMVAFFLTYVSELKNHVTQINVRCVRNNLEQEEA